MLVQMELVTQESGSRVYNKEEVPLETKKKDCFISEIGLMGALNYPDKLPFSASVLRISEIFGINS